MNWFNGPIGDAIAESMSKKLIFLVYVHDENSTEMDTLWTDETISQKCNQNSIAIKLADNTDACNQFKQIYPVTTLPTTYLIGNCGGAPIRIISGNTEKSDLIEKINNAIEIHKSQTGAVQTTSVAGPSQESEPVAASNPQSESVEDQKKKLDDRIAQAKEKLRLIQAKKQREDEEKQRIEEIERRKLGQEVLRQKKDKEDMELKRLADQKRKEKLEDELAKKRVLERIQQDREDKQKKFASEKAEMNKSKEEAKAQLELAQQKERMAQAANREKFARIQFRLTDGSSIVNTFNPDQTFDAAKLFITNKLSEMNESTMFSMHSTFPKRDYVEQDMSSTFRELQLVPSASILIIPTRSKSSKALSNLLPSSSMVSSNSANSTSSTVMTYTTDLLGFIFLPFTIIWGIISNLLGIGSSTSDNSRTESSGSNLNRSPGTSNENVRRRNIGGIHDRGNDDDENSTYNGNSTQQM